MKRFLFWTFLVLLTPAAAALAIVEWVRTL